MVVYKGLRTLMAMALLAPIFGSARDAELPDSVSAGSLDECVTKLEEQGGGWCTVGVPFLDSAVSPTNLDYYMGIRGRTGAESIFTAWTGWALDQQRERIYLLANGGHADYLGNGVYEFDLATGQWARLRDPCRLDYTVTAAPDDPTEGANTPYGFMRFGEGTTERDIPSPDCGPASSHTYDGVQFASKTGTVFWTSGIYGVNGGATFYSGKELWEFNPSRTEARNGVEPLSWKRHDLTLSTGSGGWPSSVEYSDGWLGWNLGTSQGKRFDPADPAGTITDAGDLWNEYGENNAVYDPERDVSWLASQRHGILKAPRADRAVFAEKPAGYGNVPGAALRNGNLILWNGLSVINEFDPETKRFTQFDWTGKKPGAGNNNVYSKWSYLPEHDVFVGAATGDVPVQIYKHPDEGGQQASTVDPQTFIDEASAGDEITIPPETYRKGIYVNKPLTLKMGGVRFTSAIHNKGAVVVDADGPVVLDGYTADVPPRCSGNCAGLRIQGSDYDVTLRNATILNQEMGVLTGNEGGTLVIEDSEIGETGGGSDLSHVVYAGWSDELIIRNSHIHDSNNRGHLVKSRAALTRIEDSRILGNHSRHSRLVEIPCGGHLVIENSVLQQSDRTDNAEFMMLGGGSVTNCSGNEVRPVSLALRDNRLITYRDKSPDEPARGYGPTGLMHYRAPNPPVLGQAEGNLEFANNTNEVGGDASGEGIEVLWYPNDNWPGSPPPASRLSGGD